MENRSAAGLRRSAIAERLRLREEWRALKGVNQDPKNITQKNVLSKKQQNINKKLLKETIMTKSRRVADKENSQSLAAASDVLRGVVVLVDVGSDSRALALRAALSALGATVVPAWSPLVTHLVWSQGGCRDTRARARALACRVVSPLWVEACAGAARMLPEGVFPAPPRASDLPSPATLKRLLITAERGNIPFANLLSDSQGDKPKRLRISSETEHDSTTTTDTSRDTSHDKSRDTSHDKSRNKSTDKSCETPGEEVRVNTAPRRALPISISPEQPTKSRRKLFTNREPDGTTDTESEEDAAPPPKTAQPIKMTQKKKRDLAKAERMARKLVSSLIRTDRRPQAKAPRIVLTGMCRTERQIITKAIRHLNGHVQSNVDRRTDYVLLGSCSTQCPESLLSDMLTEKLNIDINKENLMSSRLQSKTNVSGVCEISKTKTLGSCVTRVNDLYKDKSNLADGKSDNNLRSNMTRISKGTEYNMQTNGPEMRSGLSRPNETGMNTTVLTQVGSGTAICNSGFSPDKPRTVNTLLGAVRGCRVLYANWVVDSIKQNRWLHHIGYEVRHLMKISQKARLERSALGLMKREYAYNVFRGMRVRLTADTEQRDAVSQLLSICGAVITQDVEVTQNGGNQDGADITIGIKKGEICSKWVFDSIAATRMRTTRRYIN